jgi:uncharacterized membrane protein YfcA
MIVIGYVLVGLAGGMAGGLLGIGGGLIIIPALVYIFGFGQHMAQGTTLALMVPPIGLWAAWIYYQKGFVNLEAALFICLAFFLGSYFGAKWALAIPAPLLKKIFAVFLVAIAIKMFTEK